MKTFSTVLFILLLQGRLWSQPVFNMPDLYSTGTHCVTRLHTWNILALDTGNAGANQNWNFAQTAFTLIDTLDIVTIAQSPLGQVLPGDRVLLRNSGDINASYLGLSGNTLLHHGDAGSGSQLPRLHGMPQMQFPLSFGQSNSGQYTTVTTFYVGIPLGTPYVVDSVRRRTTVSYSYIFDAYGTVQTPMGSFPALRKRTISYEQDSADFYRADLGIWVINADISEAEALTFEFFSPGFQLPVMRLLDMGNDTWIDETEYLFALPLGTHDQAIQRRTVQLYPNPGTDRISLEGIVEGKDQMQVINMQGQVLEAQLASKQADLSHLPEGIYLIKIHGSTGESIIRWVKE
jgi:hypothetical protein